MERVGYFFNLEFIYVGAEVVKAPSGYDFVPKPQMATWNEPPSHNVTTHYALYDTASNSWSIHAKHVEVTAYHKETMDSKKFDDATLVTDDYTLLVPTSNKCTWDGLEWVEDVDKWRRERKEQLRSKCESELVDIFKSEALGDSHNYDCRLVDQTTLSLIIALDEGGKIYAHDGVEFLKVEHTAEQCRVVLRDMLAHIQSHRDNLYQKVNQLNLCETVEEIQAVTW